MAAVTAAAAAAAMAAATAAGPAAAARLAVASPVCRLVAQSQFGYFWMLSMFAHFHCFWQRFGVFSMFYWTCGR